MISSSSRDSGKGYDAEGAETEAEAEEEGEGEGRGSAEAVDEGKSGRREVSVSSDEKGSDEPCALVEPVCATRETDREAADAGAALGAEAETGRCGKREEPGREAEVAEESEEAAEMVLWRTAREMARRRSCSAST